MSLLFACAVGAGGIAHADIYTWRDSAGVNHYTNDPSRIPPESREGAATVAKDWDRGAPPPETAADPEAAAEKEAAEPEESEDSEDSEESPAALENVHLDAISDRGFDAGYAAGLRAAGPAQPVIVAPAMGPIVQEVEVRIEPPVIHERIYGYGRPRYFPSGSRRRDRTREWRPAESPFITGPAGPPPLGAPGPPPLAAVR